MKPALRKKGLMGLTVAVCLMMVAGVWVQAVYVGQKEGNNVGSNNNGGLSQYSKTDGPRVEAGLTVSPYQEAGADADNGLCRLDPTTNSDPLTRPPHDTSPLTQSHAANSKSRLLGCYNANHDPTRTPAAVPPIWEPLSPYLDDVRRRVANGSVLVVWTPEKFMPPQGPGKNVRGDVVDAPTKGRDSSYYLKRYRSVWDVGYKVNGVGYHAQLVDRAALVVCFWERLHITKYLCRGEGARDNETVEVHFCLCRHCKEEFAEGLMPPKMTEKPVKKNERPQKRPITHKYTVTPRTSPPSCIEAIEAPWLTPTSVVAKLPYEGLHDNLPELLNTQADENGIVVVFIFNVFWVDHLHNIVYSMVRHARMRNFIVATLDCDSLKLCVANRLPCFNAERFAEAEEDIKTGGKGFTRKVTEELSWIKPRLGLKFLDLGFHFMMVDMDMSFWRNPMQDVTRRGIDFSHQCDTTNRLSVNTGFYLLRNTPASVALFNSILVFPPPSISDQNALKLALKYDHTHGASNTCLDKWLYNMKCNYKVPNSESRGDSGTRSFKWKPQQRNRDKFDWYIFHATCLDGAVSKINWLRASNAWFLDDLDNITKADGGFCVVTPTGETVHNVRTRTVHSARYPKELDDRYLQERH